MCRAHQQHDCISFSVVRFVSLSLIHTYTHTLIRAHAECVSILTFSTAAWVVMVVVDVHVHRYADTCCQAVGVAGLGVVEATIV